MEDLNSEVRRLIDISLDKLDDLLTEDTGLNNGEDVLNFDILSQAETFRQKLAEVDLIMSDVNNIISSYLKYKSQRYQQDNHGEDSDTFKHQLEQLSNLRNNLEQQINEMPNPANNDENAD
tara:strand:+ start:374 stop:736 length:363 start_codon:yes stop_codon:yes gene_type:complete